MSQVGQGVRWVSGSVGQWFGRSACQVGQCAGRLVG